MNVAPDHDDVLWQSEHCPGKWLAGARLAWHERQSVRPLWLKDTCDQREVLWQAEHCPG